MVNIYKEFYKKLGLTISWNIIDDLIVSDANILRPIKGAAFEYLLSLIFKNKFQNSLQAGLGDSDVDKILVQNIKKTTMQIKTPAVSTIKNGVKFGISLHKTHGLEKRPNNLYPTEWPCKKCKHEGEAFPDYLIVQHPENGILIIPKEKIPESRSFLRHYSDPAIFTWDSEWLNRWDLLGFPKYRSRNLERRKVDQQERFPKLSQIIKLTDEEIIRLLLQPENFRVLDMNLKGNLREVSLVGIFSKLGIKLNSPLIPYSKYDRITDSGVMIQIKGPSKNFSNAEKNILGVEVMGTHGKGAIRCYSETDFDYLAFVIDPLYLNKNFDLDNSGHHFCIIPTKSLPLHYKNKLWRTKNKIYPICKFVVKKDKHGVFLMPTNKYRVKIEFRDVGPWYIDLIPKEFTNN